MKINPSVNDSLKERAAHGSQEFPLQVYQDMEYCENGLILYNHWHEEAEILFVTEGMMELAVDGISILAGKDTIVLIRPICSTLPISIKTKNAVFPPSYSIPTSFLVKIGISYRRSS